MTLTDLSGIYLIGFGAGSLLVAPFSETFGRIPVYICTLILFAIWIMASALAPNIGGQLAFRFLAGSLDEKLQWFVAADSIQVSSALPL